MKISELLDKKGRHVLTLPRTATVSTVAHRLQLERVGSVVISDDGKRIDGIVAVRDIVYALARDEAKIRELHGFDIMDAPIEVVMTPIVKTCGPDDTLRKVMHTMTHHHILHVPVVEDDQLAGIVSIDDVVKFAVEEMDLEKRVLQDTVAGLRTISE